MTRDHLRGSAAIALVAALGLGASGIAASAQIAPPGQTEGVTPSDQTGGQPVQTLPDDDTILPEGGTTGTVATDGQAGAPGTAPATTAQTGPTQGITPSDQTGGLPPQTLPDDDTVLPEGTGTAATGEAQRIVVLPDGSRVPAEAGTFLDLADGSQVWEYEGVQYPVVSGMGAGAPMAGEDVAIDE